MRFIVWPEAGKPIGMVLDMVLAKELSSSVMIGTERDCG